MAIRMRRGNEADFDPEKMLPGEWAVSTDTKYVRMCFAPGIVLRMATYEAFESDMAEIRKILLECQSIQTSVELIQKNVTDSELVIENYVKEAKQYRDEAEQYRNETEQFRNEAFSTTSGLIINNTASGDTIHLADSAKSKVLAFGLYGKAVQKQYTGKNLIPFPYYDTSKTKYGIEWVVYDDGKVEATGTATKDTTFYFSTNFKLKAGSYKLSGCPSGGSNSSYRIQIADNSWANGFVDIGNGALITLETEMLLSQFRILIPNGTKVTNLVFEPMIRKADVGDDTYEPYVGGIPAPSPEYPQKITISTGKHDSVAVTLEGEDITEISGFIIRTDGLAGIPVDSEGNYTDENGQQWICDEIVKYADGSGKRIQRIGMRIHDGVTNKIGYYGTTTGASGESLIQINLGSGDIKPVTGYSPYMLCDKLQASTTKRANVIMLYPYSSERTIPVVLLDSNEDIKSLDEANAWLRNNPLTTYYILAEPIETNLTASELKVYENLQTFYPVTNISNNANCGMSITYVADTKNYIDSKIASLEKALYNNI